MENVSGEMVMQYRVTNRGFISTTEHLKLTIKKR